MKMKRVICLYRVSTVGQVDHDDIPMQKIACREYAATHPDWEIVDEISEKGVSGYKISTNARDAIIEIKKKAINREFDVLLVFMFDRLGRREDETPFVVQWFVQQGIEVWSTREGEQRFDNHVDKLLNYIRFWQASGESEKTSIRVKTKHIQMVEDGQYRGGYVPYGYKLEHQGRTNKKNQPVRDLVIDEDEAAVVREIFHLLTDEGYGTVRVANYTGCLVNFKTEKLSYKVKHSVENPPEKQVIFENHHEPIIDTQTWERVQELRKQRKRPNRYDEVGLFSGILFCADCGSVMYQQRYQTDKRKQDCYICGNYKKRTHDCTAHFIRTDLLTAGVLSNLRKVTSYAAKHEARFMKLLIEQNEDGGKRRNAAKKKELEAAEKRIAELSAIFKRLYEDSVTGRISDERFTELSADYEAEQRELKERATAIQAELSKAQEATVNAEKFMNVVRRHTSFEELTPTLLREFVEKIVVHECSYDENKTRRQDIDIYYSFVGKVDLPE